jgi:hypothetical protein
MYTECVELEEAEATLEGFHIVDIDLLLLLFTVLLARNPGRTYPSSPGPDAHKTGGYAN